MLTPKVNIGQRDRLIYIIKPVYKTGVDRPSTNENEIERWDLHATDWARVTPFQGNEAMIAERITEGHHVIANIRYRSDLLTTYRFKLDDRVYEIASIPPSTDRHMSLEIIGRLLDNVTWTPT